MYTRRDFVSLSLMGMTGLFWPRWFAEGKGWAPEVGLFVDGAGLDTLRAKRRLPLFAERLPGPLPEVPEGDRYGQIIPLSQRIIQRAFWAMLEGREEAVEAVAEDVRRLIRLGRWDYLLEGEEVVGLERAAWATLAVSVALDWTGARIPADEKQRWVLALADQGVEACYRTLYRIRYPESYREWQVDPLSGYFAYRPEPPPGLSDWPRLLLASSGMIPPLSALTLGMLTYAHYRGKDERVGRWQTMSTWAHGMAHRLFAPDGSYREGVSLAAMATPHWVRMLVALRRMTGADAFDHVNWTGFVRFLREMALPTFEQPHGAIFLGDEERAAGSSVAFWVARRARDPYAQWTGARLLGAHDLWSLLWYDPTVPEAEPPEGTHLWTNDLAWAVGRTGYTAEDLTVAMVSGSVASVTRADRNSLILKDFGEPLVVTPTLSPTAGWLAGRGTETFSALLINARGQVVSPEASIEPLMTRLLSADPWPGYLFWRSDATEAYRQGLPDLRSVTRSVVVCPDWHAVVVLDKVRRGRGEATLQARFFADGRDARGDVQRVDDRTFRIRRPMAQLQGRTFALGGLTLEEGRLEDFPYVEVRTDTPSREPLLITVLTAAPVGSLGEEGAFPEVVIQAQPDGTYRIALEHRHRTLICRVLDTAEAPEVEVYTP